MKKILQKIKNMKYRNKLVILLVTASLVPVTVLALYNHVRMSKFVRKNEVESTYFILEQTRGGMDRQIEIYTSLLNYLAYLPDMEDPLLTVPKSYHKAIKEIQLFSDETGGQGGYTRKPFREMEKEWWSERVSKGLNVQWIVDRERGMISAVRNIYEEEDLKGVLCISLDYEEIFGSFRNIITTETGGLITDTEGNIVYRQENIENCRLPVNSEATALLNQIRSEYVCVSNVSRENDWKFYLYKSRSFIEESVYQLLLSEIPLIVICVLIILVLGILFSRIFTRRIELLTENMNRVNHGSRRVTVYSDAEDEVGLLIRSFRSMMEEINRLIKEVYENRIALKEFEVKALTAQINPHFLYNSLSIINWMALKSGQKEISRVTLALSTFYRTALSKGADMVSVENCIKNIEAYLQIQLVMHDNNFVVEWEIDPFVKEVLVPKLILQPVVENALEHGLDEKEEGEKILKLSFVQDGEDVLLKVEDNGMGMSQDVARSLLSYQAEGYGLKNVNDRICLLYGEEYAIRVFSRVGEGTRIEMRIPKNIKG